MHKNAQKAVEIIHKQFGQDAIFQLGDDSNRLKTAVIPSGSLSLDIALGIGGFPKGRISEIFGPESGGKTTVALHVIAEAQKRGGLAAFIDAEHALDPAYSQKIGVDINKLLVSQPDNGEQALEIADTLIKTGGVDIVVVDSVAALVPRAELEGEMGQPQMGLQARLMSQAMRKLAGSVAKSNTCLIFINQIRDKIGVLFGNPETTAGGRALKFWASVRLDIRRIQTNTSEGEKVSNTVKIKVAKNKLAAPFKECEIEILFGHGISREKDLIELGVTQNIIQKSGQWYSMKEQKFQGIDSVKKFLRENPKISSAIESQLRQIYFGG